MDEKNRLMAFGVAVLSSVVVLAVAYAAFLGYRNNAVDNQASPADVPAVQPAVATAPAESAPIVTGSHAETIFAQRSEIKFLEALLEKKTGLLERKTELLEQKTAELAAAREELDEAIATLAMLAELTFAAEEQPADVGAENQLLDDLEKLRQERERDREQDAAMAEQMEMLRAELELTDARILELQQTMGQAIETVNVERRAFERAATAALVQAGPAAVPGLVETMTNESPQIRIWAATTLGRIGRPANDAVPVLVEALSDRDEKVRAAAQRALDLIDSGGVRR